ADHNRGCIGITADDLRHDRGVCHAQARDAVHPQTWIDNSVGSRAHAAGANRMKVRDAAITQVLDQVLLAGNRRSRHNCLGDIRLQAWLLRDRTAEPRAEEHGLHVVGGLEKLELYLRGCEWIGRFEAHAAAPFWLQVDRRDHEARPRVGYDAVTVPTVDGIEGDIELQVGPVEARVGAHEDAGQRAGTGERPLPPERVFDACLEFLYR